MEKGANGNIVLLQEGKENFYILLWEWDGNENTVMGMGGNGIEQVILPISSREPQQINSDHLFITERVVSNNKKCLSLNQRLYSFYPIFSLNDRY